MPARRHYLREEIHYRLKKRGKPYYQHVPGDPCPPHLERLFGWDSFPAGGDALLELGCGDGFVTAILARRGLRVTGVDCSPSAVRSARRNLAALGLRPELRVADACGLEGFENASFPNILDSSCLHCIADDTDRARFFRTSRRVLAPGGRLFLATMSEQPMHWIEEGGPSRVRYVRDGNGCCRETRIYPGTRNRSTSRIWIKEGLLRSEIRAGGFRIRRFERFSPEKDPEDASFLLELGRVG